MERTRAAAGRTCRKRGRERWRKEESVCEREREREREEEKERERAGGQCPSGKTLGPKRDRKRGYSLRVNLITLDK